MTLTNKLRLIAIYIISQEGITEDVRRNLVALAGTPSHCLTHPAFFFHHATYSLTHPSFPFPHPTLSPICAPKVASCYPAVDSDVFVVYAIACNCV
jgi:capsular polysaccharide biosynthesis protein